MVYVGRSGVPRLIRTAGRARFVRQAAATAYLVEVGEGAV
jgi:hypothetical protein